MSKDTETGFVGQPIFKQIVNLIDAINIQVLIFTERINEISGLMIMAIAGRAFLPPIMG